METNCIPSVCVRPALQNELAFVSALELSFFQDSSLNAEGLFNWWKSYSNGVYVLLVEKILAGAMGIWPLRDNIFIRLKAGNIAETEISSDDIMSSEECSTISQANWYFGGIILEPSYRGKGLSRIFTNLVMHEWLANGNLAESIDLCGLAFTINGAKWLTNWGFNENGHMQGQHSIYVRQASVSEIRTELINMVGQSLALSPKHS